MTAELLTITRYILLQSNAPVDVKQAALQLHTPRPERGPELIQSILSELRQGHKIAAIKLLRASTGLGLCDSKAEIETYQKEMEL